MGLEESVERGFTNAQTKQDACYDSGISSLQKQLHIEASDFFYIKINTIYWLLY